MIKPYIGANVADYQMRRPVGWAKRSAPTIHRRMVGMLRFVRPTILLQRLKAQFDV
jgi:hypothetical protein